MTISRSTAIFHRFIFVSTLSSVPMKLCFVKRENRRDLKCDYFSIYRDISSFYFRLGNNTGLKFSYMQVSMAVAMK